MTSAIPKVLYPVYQRSPQAEYKKAIADVEQADAEPCLVDFVKQFGVIDCSSVRSHLYIEIWANSVDEATCNPGCDRYPTLRTLQTATNTAFHNGLKS